MSKESEVMITNQLVMAESIIESIQTILDGEEVSDFALSFGIVREVSDLKREGDKAITAMEEVFKILCMKEFADTWSEERVLKLKRLSELWNKYKDE
jgi:hypothetical protein